MTTRAFSPAVRALNKALSTDPATLAKLTKIAGRVYAIESTLPPLTLAFRPTEHGIELVDDDTSAEVRLRGTAPALARLMVATASGESPSDRREVEINGDATALLQLSQAMADLDIDWEELLAQLIGDVAARTVSQGLAELRALQASQQERALGKLREMAHSNLGLCRPEDILELKTRSRQLQYRIDRLEARVRTAEKARSADDQ